MSATRLSAISIVFLSLLLALSVACSRRPNDEKIAKDIQDKVASNPDTKDSQVDVAATKGKVTLKGKVKNPKAQKKN